MAPRARLLVFGSAALLVVAGGLCAVLVAGTLGQLLTFVLISLGLGGAVLFAFLEVGLSEDRQRAREAEREHLARGAAAPRAPTATGSAPAPATGLSPGPDIVPAR